MSQKDDAVKELAEYYGVSEEDLARIRKEVDEELERERKNGDGEDDEDVEWADCAEAESKESEEEDVDYADDDNLFRKEYGGRERLSMRDFL